MQRVGKKANGNGNGHMSSPSRTYSNTLKGHAPPSSSCGSTVVKSCLDIRLRTLLMASVVVSASFFYITTRTHSADHAMEFLSSNYHSYYDTLVGPPSKDAFVRQRGNNKRRKTLAKADLPISPITKSVVARRFQHQDFGQPIETHDESLVAITKKLPVIVLGFPKSGTTSIWNYFNCSGVLAQHFCAYGDLQDAPPCSKAT